MRGKRRLKYLISHYELLAPDHELCPQCQQRNLSEFHLRSKLWTVCAFHVSEQGYWLMQTAVLHEISQLLNTRLDKETLATCVGMIESGVNPEALAVRSSRR
jgi:uncharacterized OB-fold protein